MKLKIMKTHRVGQKSLEPYRPSKSSQKQSKTADMGQTGYAMENEPDEAKRKNLLKNDRMLTTVIVSYVKRECPEKCCSFVWA